MEAILEGSAGTSTPRADKKIWAARVLRALVVLFLLADGVGKVMHQAPQVEATAKAGYPTDCLVPLGLVLLASTLAYAIPRTAALGAALLTGYLGGAVATHVRLGEPFFMPIVFGVIVWGCLYVCDARVRALLPLERKVAHG